jgi:hypothetical protein
MVDVKAHDRKGKQEYIKVPVYSIDNAPLSLKEKILDKYRDINDLINAEQLEEDLHDSLLEELKKFKIVPLGEIKTGYSLSYSQGDGFNFTGNVKFKGKSISISRGSTQYQHERSTVIEADEENEKVNLAEVMNNFREIYYQICKKMEDLGYKIDEINRSDEEVAETLRINDYRFDSQGNIVRR